jgi:tRNA(fMet)-specific endonuclease VapC
VTYLLDTNICIYALKNRPPEVLERLGAVGLIAAHALARDLILVTNNLREFERVPGLQVENWAR